MPPHIKDLAVAFHAADARWREEFRATHGFTFDDHLPTLFHAIGSPDTPLRAAFLARHAALTAWIDAKLKQEAGE